MLTIFIYVKQIFQYGGLQSRRVGIYQEEQRSVGQHFRRFGNELADAVFQLPHFPARSSAVRRRIHQHRVVSVAAAQFARDELHTVVDDIAYAVRRTGRQRGVAAAPVDHILRRVDVRHFRPRRRERDGRPARVAEQIEHARSAAAGKHDIRHRVPVIRLLGEQPRMLEPHRSDEEAQSAVAHRPLFGKGAQDLPPAAARMRARVTRVQSGV